MVAVAIGGAAVLGAGASIIAGNQASNATRSAAQQSADVQRYMYDTTRSDYAPYRDVGQGALYKLADMYGVSRPTGTAPTTGTATAPGGLWSNYFGNTATGTTGGTATQPRTAGYEGFQASPGYQFRMDEALKSIERSAASRGMRLSGATADALQRRAQGVASSEYENYANRLASLAGVGQTSTAGTAAAGAQYAQGASQAYTQAGQARASAYQNTGNAINNGVTNLASAYLYNNGFNNTGGGG